MSGTMRKVRPDSNPRLLWQNRFSHTALKLLLVVLVTCLFPGRVCAQLRVRPIVVTLDSPEATQQLLVSASRDGHAIDFTRRAEYSLADPRIATVDEAGLVRPLAEGRTEIRVRAGRQQQLVTLEVTGLKDPKPVSFQNQIIPILTKAACNSGGCHGKAEGQNGFKLSVFGFDPRADHEALVRESRGRRVFPAGPDRSMLLLKATAAVPHGGGRKIKSSSLAYRRVKRWIAEGGRYDEDPSVISRITVEPSRQSLQGDGSQQLQVTAFDANGNRHCVTVEAEYQSNASVIADVDGRGLVKASGIPGEAAILVRYMGHAAVCRITVPRFFEGHKGRMKFKRPPVANFIDRLVWEKLEQLGIQPSGFCDDATFLRRAYLDTIGTLPSPKEARQFLEDAKPNKRARLIQRLLERDEYADYWTMRWSDLLRVDRDKMTPQGSVALTRWLRRQFAKNRPYDLMVRDIVTAKGNTRDEGPAALFKVLDKPEVLSRSVSQLFLGVRIQCAQCHHHPFEKWGQNDYFALAGFFTGVKLKSLPGGGEAVVADGGTDLKHPRTGETVPARALGAPPADFGGVDDRRVVFADWLTDRKNPYFAKVMVNRLWAHYFGRGLVEPIDDLRDTNPATNEPLLDALAEHLCDSNFDLKALIRTLLSSNVYRLSSQPNESNAGDMQNFSHARYKALPAEVLLDAISAATGVPEKFEGWPRGYRAIEIWDNQMPSYFFRIFGRPVRASVCECERSNEPTMTQAVHLINSPEISAKIQTRAGRARSLANSQMPPAEVIDELYLATLSRFPTDKERSRMLDAFKDSDRRSATEDVLWVLLNTKEFLYSH